MLLSLSVAGIIGGVAYAKYIASLEANGTITTSDFYFKSNKLAAGGKEYTINSATTELSFTLENFADSLRVSENDINYTVNVTGGASLDITSGTLVANGAPAEVTITLSGLAPGNNYTVTAVGNGKFVETLSATFKVNAPKTNVFKKLEDHSHFILVTVLTENVTGAASISIPSGLIPDNTDPIMSTLTLSDTAINDSTTFSAPYSSYSYRLFKSDPSSSYTLQDFTVTVGGKSAIPYTP